jgi:CheY-like chemotaxis protein
MKTMQEVPAMLLVEDDPDDLALAKHAFAKARLSNPLYFVRDGEEAIDYLAGHGAFVDRDKYPMPFLVLLDLHLPKLNGFEVLRWIKAQPELAGIRVAVFTSSQEERDYQEATKLGADSYYQKPGSLEELTALMLRLNAHWVLTDGKPVGG